MRVLKAVVVGLVVGVAVAAAVNSVPWWEPFRFWGLFFGTFAALISFGFALMFFGRRQPRARLTARRVTIAALLAFGLVFWWGIGSIGFPGLFTLEGAWIYPLGLAPLILIGSLVRPRRRRRQRDWDPPVAPAVSTPARATTQEREA